MNRSKQRGTAAETAVVDYLNTAGFPMAERRTLNGSHDRGDIAGIPGVVIEVKRCAKTELGEWIKEAEIEGRNAHAPIWAVWHWRRGKASPANWYVTVPGHVFTDLLREHDLGERYTT